MSNLRVLFSRYDLTFLRNSFRKFEIRLKGRPPPLLTNLSTIFLFHSCEGLVKKLFGKLLMHYFNYLRVLVTLSDTLISITNIQLLPPLRTHRLSLNLL